MRSELPVSHLHASLLGDSVAAAPRRPWQHVDVLAVAGSTNDLAAQQAQPWVVVTTDDQQAGRGRLGRGWVSPPRAGIAVSYTLPVPVPAQSPGPDAAPLGWLPLLAGAAVVEAVGTVLPSLGRLVCKWPNDILDEQDRKVVGVLCQLVPGSRGAAPVVVVGVGINVDHERHELPTPTSTSLRLLWEARSDTGAAAWTGDGRLRADLVVALADALVAAHADWVAGGERLAARQERYRGLCGTLGRRVRLSLPDGGEVVGRATGVDRDGRVVVTTDSGDESAHAAADVVHLRPVDGSDGARAEHVGATGGHGTVAPRV